MLKKLLLAALLVFSIEASAAPGAKSYRSTIPAGCALGNPNAWPDNPVPLCTVTLGFSSAANVANAQIGTLPPNAIIVFAAARETAGHNVTISIGSTSGGTDVASSVSLTASTASFIPAATFAKNWFSAGSTQAIFISSASWSSASVNITVYYLLGP